MTDALGDRFWIRMHDECDEIARINFTEIRPNRWSSHMVGGVRVIFNERYTRINAKSKKRILEMTEGALSSRTFPGGLEALVYMVSPRLDEFEAIVKSSRYSNINGHPLPVSPWYVTDSRMIGDYWSGETPEKKPGGIEIPEFWRPEVRLI